MTKQKSFKRLVRARMEKTGQSYTAARAALLSDDGPPPGSGGSLFTVSDAVVRRTGRGWEEWLDLLDAWGPVDRRHGEITRWLPDDLSRRTATRPRSARYDWADGSTRVIVSFEDRGEAKSTIALSHERIADAAQAQQLKTYWRERVAALKELLERA